MLRPKNRIENHFQLLMKNAILKVTIIFIADEIQLPGMADQLILSQPEGADYALHTLLGSGSECPKDQALLLTMVSYLQK